MKDTYTTDNVAEILIFYLFFAKKRKETSVNYNISIYFLMKLKEKALPIVFRRIYP